MTHPASATVQMPRSRRITACRLCGDRAITGLLELGEQYLTGVFPRDREAPLTRGPLTLVRCDRCGLVQLLHSFERDEMYGEHYGYRSSLNAMMVEHLGRTARDVAARVALRPGDVVIDIGSNDGTTLSFFSGRDLTLVGFDPSAARWRDRYPRDSTLVADFFSAASYRAVVGSRQAKVVTSIAMFYDLEAPLDFACEVAGILADDGIWLLEQSYLPAMLRETAYDTICHEHLEYYAFQQIRWIAERAGLRVLDVMLSDVNGGSFAVVLGRRPPAAAARARIDAVQAAEATLALSSPAPFRKFGDRVRRHREHLVETLEVIHAQGRSVLGYGASTKGNVMLQYAGIDARLLPAIAEVNADKFGCVTPGTWIPIIPEAEAHAMKPDHLLVMPWHFRAGIVQREATYLADGGILIFPLPRIELVRQVGGHVGAPHDR
jgi:hypothetical protein